MITLKFNSLFIGCLMASCASSPLIAFSLGDYKYTLCAAALAAATVKTFVEVGKKSREKMQILKAEVPNFESISTKTYEEVNRRNRESAGSQITYYADWDRFIEREIKPKNPDLAQRLLSLSKSSNRYLWGCTLCLMAAVTLSVPAYEEIFKS